METVLEEFNCFLDKVDGSTAYFTMTAANGDVLWAEYPADKLMAMGVRERRRFKCRTIENEQGWTRIEFETIPDKELTEEFIQEVDRLVSELGDE